MSFSLDNLRVNNLQFERKNIKKIVNVYQERYVNCKAQGLGDFIRGSYCLYQLCKKFNIEFEMNLKNHTLSKFLDNDNVKYPENLCKNILRFKEPNFIHNTKGKMVREINFYGKITNYLNNVNTVYNNSLFIGCNSFPIWDTLTNEQREYVKSILNPNEDMKTYINNTLNELGLKEKEYDVIHVRCGDKFINSNNISQMGNYERIMDVINKHTNESTKYILISDCNALKNSFKDRKNFYVYFKDITHLGENFVKTDENVKNTLLDFFIMSKSKNILSISKYEWGSGFSDWCANTYRIPIQKKLVLEKDPTENLKNMNQLGINSNHIDINVYQIINNKSLLNNVVRNNFNMRPNFKRMVF